MGSNAPFWPAMMKRETAARYCDLTMVEFDKEVAIGRLPLPAKLGKSDHWSRALVDDHLARIADEAHDDWRKGSKLYGEAA